VPHTACCDDDELQSASQPTMKQRWKKVTQRGWGLKFSDTKEVCSCTEVVNMRELFLFLVSLFKHFL